MLAALACARADPGQVAAREGTQLLDALAAEGGFLQPLPAPALALVDAAILSALL